MSPQAQVQSPPETGMHAGKNIAFLIACLLLWVAARVLHARVFAGTAGFKTFDVAFVVLPGVAAFFLNWYWMRERRTDDLVKAVAMWAGVDLVVCIVVIIGAVGPLYQFLQSLNT